MIGYDEKWTVMGYIFRTFNFNFVPITNDQHTYDPYQLWTKPNFKIFCYP